MVNAAETVTPPLPVTVEDKLCSVEETPRAWTLISLEQLEQLHAAKTAVERVEHLQRALKVQRHCCNPRTSVWVDFCFGVLSFAQDEAHLAPEKTLVLLTLANEVYEYATKPLSIADLVASENVGRVPALTEESIGLQGKAEIKKDLPALRHEYPSMEAVYEQFRAKVRQVSGVVGGWNAEVSFSTPLLSTEVAQIVTFFSSTFFRHLRAHQYLSRVPRQSVMREYSLPTETPLPPQSLAEAILHAEQVNVQPIE